MKEVVVDSATRELLRSYAAQYETAEFLNGDPSWWMHQVYGDQNQETMAFLASSLSFGSRKQFMPKIGQLLEWSGGDAFDWVRTGAFNVCFHKGDSDCYYRLYNNDCMYNFLSACQQLIVEHGSLGAYVRQNANTGMQAVEAICSYFCGCGVSVVVPKNTQSACKRVCMFLRWMVRSDSPVDLGLWSEFIDRRTLIMPLDTHVLNQSLRLGLLSSGTASMSAAIRLTTSLSTIFPDDPLKGDFALFGYGVNNVSENKKKIIRHEN